MKKQLVPAVNSHILALSPALRLIHTHTLYIILPQAITTECLTLPLTLTPNQSLV